MIHFTNCSRYSERVYAPENTSYIYIYTSVLVCIYMHREFGAICKLDPVVELIWSKVCITKAITKAITTSIVKAIASCLTRSKSGNGQV